MKKLLFVTTALIITAPAAYAVDDSFGNRFGNNTPYALDNKVSTALDDTQGITIDDIDDLVNIAPAAGNDNSVDADLTIDADAGAEDAQAGIVSGQSTTGVGVEAKIETQTSVEESEAKPEPDVTPETAVQPAPEDVPASADTAVTTATPQIETNTVPAEGVDAEAAADAAEIEMDVKVDVPNTPSNTDVTSGTPSETPAITE